MSIACPKCAGTGTVSRFLDYKGGVCFDCNGEGTVALVGPRRSKKAAPIALTVELAAVGLVIRAGYTNTIETIAAIEDVGGGVILITTNTGAQFFLDANRAPSADFLAIA